MEGKYAVEGLRQPCRFRKEGKNAASPKGGGHLKQFGQGYYLG
jgi:hypothetical protein